MGAWDYGIYSNDIAMDSLCEIQSYLENRERTLPIEIRRVFSLFPKPILREFCTSTLIVQSVSMYIIKYIHRLIGFHINIIYDIIFNYN